MVHFLPPSYFRYPGPNSRVRFLIPCVGHWYFSVVAGGQFFINRYLSSLLPKAVFHKNRSELLKCQLLLLLNSGLRFVLMKFSPL